MEHAHSNWQPGAVFHQPGRYCACGYFEQISKREFKDFFRISFWRWAKEYADLTVFGGYMKWKMERCKIGRFPGLRPRTKVD